MKDKELIERLNLKHQAKKWKNISVIFLMLAFFFLLKFLKEEETIGKEDYIARIFIDGIIENNQFRNEKLEEIKDDKSIKAVILHIDSPGGEIVGSEILYKKIRSISSKKPVVIVMENIATSGGYMVALGGDYIIASNGTITGSIGVILQTFEVLDFMKKMGVNPIIYKSSELKASPSMFEKPTPKTNRVLQETINDSYNFFLELVANRRQIPSAEVLKIGDGRIFTGRQALDVGLVDLIGHEGEALEYLRVKRNINTRILKIENYQINERIEDLRFKKLFGSFILNLKHHIQEEGLKYKLMAI